MFRFMWHYVVEHDRITGFSKVILKDMRFGIWLYPYREACTNEPDYLDLVSFFK